MSDATQPGSTSPPEADRDHPALSRLKKALARRYVIEREIGCGGMATVFLAKDLKHRRKVALKVLNSGLSSTLGPDRFLREIEFAARLHHPHILPLYDSGKAGPFLFYVMPYVEGESLRAKLYRHGPLPVQEALRIVRDVADALASAHASDVIHRDIKPDNVMLSGRHALVMDFGVAKAVSQAGDGKVLTSQGVTLGTPRYMAPEQAAGDPAIDHRADIYAVGIMAYELIAGRPPIEAETPQATLAAQVTEIPRRLDHVMPDVPQEVADLVMRCLEKRPEDRWQSAEDLLAAVDAHVVPSAISISTEAIQAAVRRTTRSKVGAGIVGTLALASAVVVVPALRGGALPAPAPLHTQLTFSGSVVEAEISPNGEFLALATDSHVLVQDLRGGTALELAARDPRAESRLMTLRWSPDGSQVLVVERDSAGAGEALAYPRLGGAPRVMPVRGYAAWSPDGRRIAWWYRDSPVYLQDLAGGMLDSIVLPSPHEMGERLRGDWSPDGRFIALETVVHDVPPRFGMWAVAVDGSTRHRVVEEPVAVRSPRWAGGGGALYYLHDADTGSELRKIRLAADGRSRGAPRVLLRGLAVPGQLSLTADGTALVVPRVRAWADVWLADADRRQRPLQFHARRRAASASTQPQVRASPDGALIAYAEDSEDGAAIMVASASDDAPPLRITVGGRLESAGAAWSPDGRSLAVLSEMRDTTSIRIVSLTGETRTIGLPDLGTELQWAAGGRLVVQQSDVRNFRLIDPHGSPARLLVPNDSPGWMTHAELAPDGAHVAVYWYREGRGGVWVVSLDDGTQTPLLSGADYRPLGWSQRSDLVYVLDRDTRTILSVPADGGLPAEVGVVPFASGECTLQERGDTVSLACGVPRAASDAWMMEYVDPEWERAP